MAEDARVCVCTSPPLKGAPPPLPQREKRGRQLAQAQKRETHTHTQNAQKTTPNQWSKKSRGAAEKRRKVNEEGAQGNAGRAARFFSPHSCWKVFVFSEVAEGGQRSSLFFVIIIFSGRECLELVQVFGVEVESFFCVGGSERASERRQTSSSSPSSPPPPPPPVVIVFRHGGINVAQCTCRSV